MGELLGPIVAPAAFTAELELGPAAEEVDHINLVCSQPVFVECFAHVDGMPAGKYVPEGRERYVPTTHVTGLTITNVAGIRIRSADPAHLATVQAELAYAADPQFDVLPSAV